jgi:hypothetical protein
MPWNSERPATGPSADALEVRRDQDYMFEIAGFEVWKTADNVAAKGDR